MKMFLVLMALVGGSSFAHAQGDAGCGLGSMIIQENTKVMQILAATTNGTGGQTFAISTGTSNCKSQQVVRNDKAIQYFAEANQADLSREIAQGQGEKLHTLASLYGCSDMEKQKAFATRAQASYSKILPTPDTQATEMVRNLNANVANTCASM